MKRLCHQKKKKNIFLSLAYNFQMQLKIVRAELSMHTCKNGNEMEGFVFIRNLPLFCKKQCLHK